MKQPRLLDLYCGAGLAADGYAAAGFDIFGVDIRQQPNYPYLFSQSDALPWLSEKLTATRDFDAIHASPPCQLFTRAKHLRDAQGSKSKETVDLLTPTLELLRERWSHKVWVVENVESAGSLMEKRDGEYRVKVCGSSFGLGVQRHRLFLSNVPLVGTECAHSSFPIDPVSGKPRPWGVYHAPNDDIPKGGRTARDAEHAGELFGLTRSLPWDSIKEGFPPAYTRYIGKQFMAAVEMERAGVSKRSTSLDGCRRHDCALCCQLSGCLRTDICSGGAHRFTPSVARGYRVCMDCGAACLSDGSMTTEEEK